jgi:filamentous hemagglutinin family protein
VNYDTKKNMADQRSKYPTQRVVSGWKRDLTADILPSLTYSVPTLPRSRFHPRSMLQLQIGTALLSLMTAGVFTTVRVHAETLPTGGRVTVGRASIGNAGNTLTVNQSSSAAIINWNSFSIGSAGKVQVNNGLGATLNRVKGNVPTSIDGQLKATGSVYIVNPAGVTVGTGGMVATGGSFVASTHDVDSKQFTAGGAMTFKGSSTAAVVNKGRITSLGGDVALIARRVNNSGAIQANKGTAALAAGYEVLMRDNAHAEGKFIVKVGGGDTEVRTTGIIKAMAAMSMRWRATQQALWKRRGFRTRTDASS